jgi:putative ABC transport system permease protein
MNPPQASPSRVRSVLSFKLAALHLTASMGRLALTIVAVAVGVSLVVAVQLMNGDVLAAFLETVDGLSGRSALTIGAGESFTFSERVVERVAGIPGVRLAVPLVRSVAFPDDGSGELLTVLGVDLANEAAVRAYHDGDRPEEVVSDLLGFLSQPDSIIVGRQWASSHGLSVGDQVALVTPTGRRAFTVRGLVEPRGLASTLAGRVVVMDLYAAERAFTADGQISQIDLVLDEDADVGRVQGAVAAILPPGLSAQEPAVRRDVIRDSVRGFQAMMMAFALLAVLAGFVICYSRLRTLFDARTWEVGLYRAVGLRQSVVFVELLKEAAIIGVLGVVIGVPLGIAVAWYAFPFLATATALNFCQPVPAARGTLQASGIALGVIVGILAAVLAAVLPGLRLARTQPVDALRLRGRAMAPLGVRARLLLAAAALLVTLTLTAAEQVWQVSWLGGFVTTLLVLAVVALAPPLVVHGSRVLGLAFGSLFGPVGRLAAAEVRDQAGRTSLAVATLGLGLGSVLLFGILGWSFERSLIAQLGARFRAHLIVNSAFVSGGWTAAPLRDEIVDEVGAVPGVALAAGQHLAQIDYGGGMISLFSYDASCFTDQRVCQWPLRHGALPEALVQVATGEGVLLSSSIAKEHALAPGDVITLPSPTGPQELRVVGIAAHEPAHAVVMSRERYRRGWNDADVTWIHVVLDRPEDEAAVAAAIAARLGGRYRVQVRTVRDFLAYLAGAARQAFSSLYVMEAVTLLLVLFGIGDALAASVLERSRQFALLHAVGVRPSRLASLVLLEGAGIAILGIVLAAATGVALSLFWVRVQFPALLGWNLDYSFPGTFVATAAFLSLLLCIVGSMGPSLRAARLSVPQALRDE